MKNILDSIQQNYQYLVPTTDEIIILVSLREKIVNEEIPENFIYQNLKKIVKEALSLPEESNRRTEDILRKLLRYFIERPIDMPNNYKLTDYAYHFIGLLENKVSNKYYSFPLKDSFETYAKFSSEDIETIDQFEEWFELGFNKTYKEKVRSHIEGLKDNIKNCVNELNSVLYTEEKDTLTIVNRFKSILNHLEDKALDIQNAIQTDIQLNIEIRKVINYFYVKLETVKTVDINIDQEHYERLTQDWQNSVSIQKEVKQFFKEIKGRLGQLREKIVFASEKLDELPEYFKYQTKVKVNLRKLLEFTLKNSQHSNGNIILPKNFPVKYLVYEDFQLYNFPLFSSFLKQKSQILEPVIDREYELQERKKIGLEFQQQERIVNWLERCKQQLRSQQELNFTEKFYEIIHAENNVNIPIQVAYELLEYAHNSTEYQVAIDRNINEQYLNEEVIVWQMNIIPKV